MASTLSAQTRCLIEGLQLKAHPEGGYYRETYRCGESLSRKSLPRRYQGKRAMATAIYYLLGRNDFSALHRVQSDELWYFHAGAPLDIVMLSEAGVLSNIRLGLNLIRGERPQAVIPRGIWFGARRRGGVRGFDYTLTSCSVAPGFNFADFEMAKREILLKKFPQHRREILKWTRENGEAKVTR